MYRSRKYGFVGRTGVSAALALGALATGVGVASAATHHSSPSAASARHAATHRPGQRGPWAMDGVAPGDGGVVTDVSSSSITIRDRSGTSSTYTIDPSTIVTRGRAAATATDLATGERVRIVPSTSSASSASSIEIELAHVAGRVSSVSSSAIVVTDFQGFERTIALSTSTAYTKAGTSASLADVTTGSFVFAEGKVDANKTSLDAATVGIGQPGVPAGPGPAGGPDGFGPTGPGGGAH